MTIEDALAHPTWKMGPKITIDSSTLMNKGLEVIEAHELFGIGYDEIEVVVHPQSIIHSMVEFCDGATIAQLSNPDMRLPIGYALSYPERFGHPYGAIDWLALRQLDFDAPDLKAFSLPRPCLRGRPRRRRHAGVAERRERGRGRRILATAGSPGSPLPTSSSGRSRRTIAPSSTRSRTCSRPTKRRGSASRKRWSRH